MEAEPLEPDRYRILEVARGAMIHECQDCGALIYRRAVHDAWHALHELADALEALDARADDRN